MDSHIFPLLFGPKGNPMAQPLPESLFEEEDVALAAARASWTAAVNKIETEDDTPVDNLFSAKR